MPCYAYQAYKKEEIEITHEHVPCFRKKKLIVLFMLFLYFSSKWGTLYLGTPSLQTQWIHDKHEST